MRLRAVVVLISVLFRFGGEAQAGDSSTRAFVSAPLIVGINQHVGVDTVTDSIVGARPEIVVARVNVDFGWGVGAYGEALDVNGDETLFGGGFTGVVYFGYFGAALSAGADARLAAGVVKPVPTFGGFLGLRIALEPAFWHSGFPFDIPMGIRVDARPGYDVIPTSIAFQLQLDVLFVMTMIVYAVSHPNWDK